MDHNDFLCFCEENAALYIYKCNNCKKPFTQKIRGEITIKRSPFLMACMHSICEDCKNFFIKYKEASCGICKYSFSLDESSIKNFFIIDRYLYGFFKTFGHIAKSNSDVLPFLPAGAIIVPKKSGSHQKKFVNKQVKMKCSQTDCRKSADVRCIDCREVYCTVCDKRAHESIRILKNHVRYAIGSSTLSECKILCPDHTNCVPAEYYCTKCEDTLCAKCIIREHNGHPMLSIEEKNKHDLPNFKEVLHQAQCVLKCMQKTKKDVDKKIEQPDDISDVDRDIMEYFVELHSHLQVLENNLLQHYNKVKNSRFNQLSEISEKLKNNIDILKPLVQTGVTICKKNTSQKLENFHLSQLERLLKDNLNLPCYLIDETPEDDKGNTPKITWIIDENFLDTITKNFKFDDIKERSFRLLPKNDFPKKYLDEFVYLSDASESALASSRTSSELNLGNNRSIDECNTRVSISAESIENLSPINNSTKLIYNKENEPVILNKGTEEFVRVSHIINPSHFYIQLLRKCRKINELTLKYQTYANNATILSELKIGNLYLVRYGEEENSKWYRARLTNISETINTDNNDNDDDEDNSNNNEKLYRIFFIDFGDSTDVTIDRIREICPEFLETPPFAYQCRLHMINPPNNIWSDEVQKYMILFIDGSPELRIEIVDNDRNVLDVYLRNYLYTLNDCLLYMGFGEHVTTLSPSQSPPSSSPSIENIPLPLKNVRTDKKIFSSINNYRKDNIYNIIIVHVHDPDHIYIVNRNNRDNLYKLELDMAKDNNKQLIFKPEIGYVYAVKLPAKKRKFYWRRAQVISIKTNGIIEVFYLDHGITECINWNQLRKLKDPFRTHDAQAVRVKLTDIEPPKHNDHWPEETVQFLRYHLTTNNNNNSNNDTERFFSIHINAIIENDYLNVTLFEVCETKDVCINALLVEKQFAESIGEKSVLVEYQKILPVLVTESKHLNHKDLITDINTIQQQQQLRQDQQSTPVTTTFKNRRYVAVNIMYVESPSNFYVTLTTWHSDREKLMADMFEYYSKQQQQQPPLNNQWQPNMVCVVYSLTQNKYYRAIIKEIIIDDDDDDTTAATTTTTTDNNNDTNTNNILYYVFFKDFCKYEWVRASQIYELNGAFGIHDYTIKCRLTGIKAAGSNTEDQWSHTALERFQALIKTHETDQFYMTRIGHIVNKTIPIDLIAVWETNNGALEPIQMHTISLNEILLDEGLALPKIHQHQLLLERNVNNITELTTNTNITTTTTTQKTTIINSLPVQQKQQLKTMVKKPKRWLPAVPFNQKHLRVRPTYVDYDGYIYVQTIDAQNKTGSVRRLLDNYFVNKPVATDDHHHDWSIGDLCIAQYHNDQSFYRAYVLDVHPNTIKVQFIDFGNEEDCSPDELRTDLLLVDQPALANKCALNNVIPKTADLTWPIHVLDILHFTIVDKNCDLFVDENTGNYPLVTLTLDNHSINAKLEELDWELVPIPKVNKKKESKQQQRHAVKEEKEEEEDGKIKIEKILPNDNDNNNTSKIETETTVDAVITLTGIDKKVENNANSEICEIDQSIVLRNYEYINMFELNDNCSTFETYIINCIDYRTVVIEPAFISELKRNTADKYDKMLLNINEQANNLLPMEKVCVGMPCIALYDADDTWYRAEIVHVDDATNEIKILYVDYGNTEIVPINLLRPFQNEWFQVPVLMYKGRLADIYLASNIDKYDALLELKDALVGHYVLCEVIQQMPNLTVKLYNKKTNELAYQKLIDERFLINNLTVDFEL